jgi:hypothetical protein
VACLFFQLLKFIAQLIVLSKCFLNEPRFYGSANIFETQDVSDLALLSPLIQAAISVWLVSVAVGFTHTPFA